MHMRKLLLLSVVFTLITAQLWAQQRTVTGQVTDDKGSPIPFATITETGTKNATTADAKGAFSITIKQGSKLTISSTGFAPATMNPTDGAQTIVLAVSSASIQEVVVTALGIKRSEKALGYAVTKVDPNSILQKS